MIEQTNKPRRWTSDYYVVFNRDTAEAIGRVLNFSDTGILLMTADEIRVPSVLRCRMVLPAPVDGRVELLFDAESRWGRRNEKNDWYETGFHITAMDETDRRIFLKIVNDTTESDSTSADRQTQLRPSP